MRLADGSYRELGRPRPASFDEASGAIFDWIAEAKPAAALVLLDQPTIVNNATGQRPVEQLASPSVGLRYGGMQPAFTGRAEMFGEDAPVWPFLAGYGGAADLLDAVGAVQVLETYPVLALDRARVAASGRGCCTEVDRATAQVQPGAPAKLLDPRLVFRLRSPFEAVRRETAACPRRMAR